MSGGVFRRRFQPRNRRRRLNYAIISNAEGLNLIKVIDETLEVWDVPGFIIDHETGDFSQYDASPGAGSVVSPGLNGTSYKFQQTLPDSGEARKNISLTEDVITYEAWIDVSNATVTGGTLGMQINSFSLTLMGTAWWTNNQEMYLFYRHDGGSVSYFDDRRTISLAPHKYKLVMKRGTTGTATDGRAELYIDDVLKYGDDVDIDGTFDTIYNITIGNNNSGGSGTVSFDELRVYDGINGALSIITLVKVIAETLFLYLVGDANTQITHDNQDFSEYTTSPTDEDCYSFVAPGLGGSSYALKVEAAAASTTPAPPTKTISPPTGDRFEISFRLDMSCFTVQGDATEMAGIKISDGAGNLVLRTTVLNSDNIPTGLTAELTDDNAATTTINATATREDPHLYKIILIKASGASNNDGQFEFYLDGTLQGTQSGLDLYDNWTNLTTLETGIYDVRPGMDGYILIDEINVSTVSNNAIYVLSTITFLIEVISETVNLVLSNIKASGFVRVLSETVNLSETIRKIYGYVQVIATDTVNLAETALDNLGLIKILSETVNLAEAKQYLLGLYEVINETVNVSETLVKLSNLLRVTSETVNVVLSSISVRGLTRVLDTDYIQIVESKLRVRTLVRVISEAVNVSEIIARLMVMVRLIGETVNLVEAIQYIRGLVQIITGTVNLVTGTIKRLVITRIISEVVNLGESIISSRILTRIIEGIIQVSETSLRIIGLVRVITGTVNLVISNLYTKGADFIEVVLETVNTPTNLIRITGLIRIRNEVVNIIETVLRIQTLRRIVSETINLAETVIKPVTFVRIISTGYVRIVEARLRIRGLVRVVSGVVNIVESIIHLKAMTRIISGTVNLAETVAGNPVLYTLANIAQTGVRITGILTRIKLKVIRGLLE